CGELRDSMTMAPSPAALMVLVPPGPIGSVGRTSGFPGATRRWVSARLTLSISTVAPETTGSSGGLNGFESSCQAAALVGGARARSALEEAEALGERVVWPELDDGVLDGRVDEAEPLRRRRLHLGRREDDPLHRPARRVGRAACGPLGERRNREGEGSRHE